MSFVKNDFSVWKQVSWLKTFTGSVQMCFCWNWDLDLAAFRKAFAALVTLTDMKKEYCSLRTVLPGFNVNN
jgi:hypothetical protein